MARIPRNERFVDFQPSAPVLTPLSLGDTSAFSNALFQGAQLAAKERTNVQKAQDDLSVNQLGLEVVDAEKKVLQNFEHDVTLNRDFEGAFEASNQEILDASSSIFDPARFPDMSRYHQSASQIIKNNYIASAQSKLKLRRAEILNQFGQAAIIEQEESLIAAYGDHAQSIEATNAKAELLFNGRELNAGTKDGGAFESVAQVQNARNAFDVRRGKAIAKRYVAEFVALASDLGHKKAKILSKDQKGGNFGNVGTSDLRYPSFNNFLKNAQKDFGDFFPADFNWNEFIYNSNKSVTGALSSAIKARKDAAAIKLTSSMIEVLERSIQTHKPMSDKERRAMFSLAIQSGYKDIKSMISFIDKLDKMSKVPTAKQAQRMEAVESHLNASLTATFESGQEPNISELMNTHVFENLKFDDDKTPLIHQSDIKILSERILGETKAQNTRVNTAVSSVIESIVGAHKIGKKRGGRPAKYSFLSDMLGGDFETMVRRLVMSEFRAGGDVNVSKITDTVNSLLLDGPKPTSNSVIRIERDVLDAAMLNFERSRAGLHPDGKLSTMDRLILDAANVKVDRDNRLLASIPNKEMRALLDSGKPLPEGETKFKEAFRILNPSGFRMNQALMQSNVDALKTVGKTVAMRKAIEEATHKEYAEMVFPTNVEVGVGSDEFGNVEVGPAVPEIPEAPEMLEAPEIPEAPLSAAPSSRFKFFSDQQQQPLPEVVPSPEEVELTGSKLHQLLRATTKKQRVKATADYLRAADDFLNDTIGSIWNAVLEDAEALDKLALSIVKEHGSKFGVRYDPDHVNPDITLRDLPKLLRAAMGKKVFFGEVPDKYKLPPGEKPGEEKIEWPYGLGDEDPDALEGAGDSTPTPESGRVTLPTLEETSGPFDPEGDGYDYKSARDAGLSPDETGHWPSRDPDTGLILKGRGHETFHKTITGEEEAGYLIYKDDDGRYYSVKDRSIPESTPLSEPLPSLTRKQQIQQRKISLQVSGNLNSEKNVQKFVESIGPNIASNVDPRLIMAIIENESSFDPKAKSPKNAIGLMQIKDTTATLIAKATGLDAKEILTDPAANIQAGIWLFYNDIMPRYDDVDSDDQTKFALAEWNSSPRAIKKAQLAAATDGVSVNKVVSDFESILRYLPEETRKFVTKVATSFGARK